MLQRDKAMHAWRSGKGETDNKTSRPRQSVTRHPVLPMPLRETEFLVAARLAPLTAVWRSSSDSTRSGDNFKPQSCGLNEYWRNDRERQAETKGRCEDL